MRHEIRRLWVASAMIALHLVTVGTAFARQTPKAPILLNFWKTSGDQADMVDFTIPLVGERCPDGFSITEDPAWCGRTVFLHVAFYYGGEQMGGERMSLQYRRNPSGEYWQTFIMVFPGLREIEVEPFQDAMGLTHHVVGTVRRLNFDHGSGVWRVIARTPEATFFAETEGGLPSVPLNLECVTAGELQPRAALN